MPLTRLVLENYRCFRDRQEIELAPVTVVLGKNNSGKSVLTRAPLVIATGFGTSSDLPLDLDRLGPDAVDDFTDLYFERNVYRPFSLEVEVDDVSNPFELGATIHYVDLLRKPVVRDWWIKSPDCEATFRWQVPTADELRNHRRGDDEYEIVTPDGTYRLLVTFSGLNPRYVRPMAMRKQPDLRSGLGLINYLGPYRERWSRQHRLPLGTPDEVGTSGEGVPAILADDRARRGGKLLDAVNELLRAIVPGWRLDIIPDGSRWVMVLTRQGGSKLRVNLADAGSGLSQVLPILVQCCALRARLNARAMAPLQIIEEPEMHLHPAAHAELADLYLRMAETTGTRFLVETHSETLLLRLRRRIAEENNYPPEMVAVYVVEQTDGVSTVRRVGIDSLGNLDEGWPEGYFSQDYHEVRALAKAQARRRRDAS